MLPKQEYVGLLIGVARRTLKQAVTARALPFRLTSQQFWMLVALHANPDASLGELAERQRFDLPTASRVVAGLVRRRLLKLERDPGDRRRARLQLTAAGAALAPKLQKEAEKVRAAVVAGLSASEQETLRGLLRRVIGNLEGLSP